MTGSNVLQAGWSLAANDAGAGRRGLAHRIAAADPDTVALVCASRSGGPGFEVLSTAGCPIPLARDRHGVFHFARGAGRPGPAEGRAAPAGTVASPVG